MLKVRITFVNNDEGNKELNRAIKKIESDYDILNKSKIYKGRNKCLYSNIYLDLQGKNNE